MELRNYGNREPVLLRLAPWADLLTVRNAFAEKLITAIETRPHWYSDLLKKQAKEFASGERCYMRGCDRFRDLLHSTLIELYTDQYNSDPKFREAFHEFKSYFFHSDDYLGICQ